MSMSEYSFLFSSLDSKQPNTTRKVHIRRLYDILQLCIQRQDWPRAKRAWGILARCQEVDWKTTWRTSVLLLGEGIPQDTNQTQANGVRVRFLSVMMRQHPGERESILKELILRLIHAGMYRRAMEELDLYLPSYPYQDNPVFHTYAGLIALHLAQPASGISSEITYGTRQLALVQGWVHIFRIAARADRWKTFGVVNGGALRHDHVYNALPLFFSPSLFVVRRLSRFTSAQLYVLRHAYSEPHVESPLRTTYFSVGRELGGFRGKDWDLNLVRDAQAHFERSRAIDPEDVVAEVFLSKLPGATQAPRDRHSPDSDDEKMNVDEPTPARKRTRT